MEWWFGPGVAEFGCTELASRADIMWSGINDWVKCTAKLYKQGLTSAVVFVWCVNRCSLFLVYI